jgi:hypothetical protein
MVITAGTYLVAGLINLFVYRFTEAEYISAVYVLVLSLPIWLPMGKLVNFIPVWKIK